MMVDDSQQHATAAVFYGPDKPLALESIKVPNLSHGGVLVGIECCTLCGSDLSTFRGKRQEPTPTILGHEVVGRVARIGRPVIDLSGQSLQEGDRVVWGVAVACGNCRRCLRGIPQKCESVRKFGHQSLQGDWPLSGGLADYCHLPARTDFVKIDEQMPAEIVCPASCATATVAAAIRVAGRVQGSSVLILGAGMLGLTAAAMARTRGASSVCMCDPREERAKNASKFGADQTVGPAELDEANQVFDIILEMSGAPEAVEAGLRKLEIGGTLVLVGSVSPSRPVSIEPEGLVRGLRTIVGLHNYGPSDLSSAVDFLKEFGHEYPFAELVVGDFRLANVREAFDFAIEKMPVRTAVRP